MGTLHTTSCVWPKSPSVMITIMMRFEIKGDDDDDDDYGDGDDIT